MWAQITCVLGTAWLVGQAHLCLDLLEATSLSWLLRCHALVVAISILPLLPTPPLPGPCVLPHYFTGSVVYLLLDMSTTTGLVHVQLLFSISAAAVAGCEPRAHSNHQRRMVSAPAWRQQLPQQLLRYAFGAILQCPSTWWLPRQLI